MTIHIIHRKADGKWFADMDDPRQPGKAKRRVTLWKPSDPSHHPIPKRKTKQAARALAKNVGDL